MCKHNLSCPYMLPNLVSYALHVCVYVCAWIQCTRTVIPARQCMYVCIRVFQQSIWSLSLLRVDPCMWVCVAFERWICLHFLSPSFARTKKIYVSQSWLQDDACACIRVCIDACMFVCMWMNKAYANTATPGRRCMSECMNRVNALPGDVCMSVCVCAWIRNMLRVTMHVRAYSCVCVCVSKAYARCDCCEVMHARAHVCSWMRHISSRYSCEAMHART